MRYLLILALLFLSSCSISLEMLSKDSYLTQGLSKSDIILMKSIEVNIVSEEKERYTACIIFYNYLLNYNAQTPLNERNIDGYFDFMFTNKDSSLYQEARSLCWKEFRDKVKKTYGGLSNEKK